MAKSSAKMWLFAAALLCGGEAQAQDKEPSAEIEVGGASDWNVRGAGMSFGPAAAIEVTPLRDLLEIEAGVAPLFGSGCAEEYRSSIQNAVHPVRYFRIDDRCGTGMDLHGGRCWENWRRGGARFSILAMARTTIRLVSGTKLQLFFRWRPRTIAWCERGLTDCNSINRHRPADLSPALITNLHRPLSIYF